ncbi:MAG: helix-turn-helix domain-containing protein [Alphaproteobacteria bacterium]|nr:helix-turn-helix domain-containing protein [Alphaproteobacteria bacterium]
MASPSAVRAPDAAKYIGLSASTLAKLRMHGTGPTYAKLGPRVVVYRIADLDAWLASNRRKSTVEPKAA